MNRVKALIILRKAIRVMPYRSIERLRHHLDRGTTILCSEQTHLYTDGKGGGCPEVLASTRSVSKTRYDGTTGKEPCTWVAMYLCLEEVTNYNYGDALRTLDEGSVRASIRRSVVAREKQKS